MMNPTDKIAFWNPEQQYPLDELVKWPDSKGELRVSMAISGV